MPAYDGKPCAQHRRTGEGGALPDPTESLNVSKIKISIVEENTQLRKWYESYGFIHVKTVKYDFFPFTCGYMEKHIQQDTR